MHSRPVRFWRRPNDSESAVFPGVAQFTRVCAYDRPGTLLFEGGHRQVTAAGDGRAQVLLLGMVLAALKTRPEGRMAPRAEQLPAGAGRGRIPAIPGGHGYPLSPIEHVPTGERSSEGAHSEYCS